MAALTVDQQVPAIVGGQDGFIHTYDVTGTDTIYKGAIVSINGSGNVAPCPTGALAGGIALEQVVNPGAAGTSYQCKVLFGAVVEIPWAAKTKAEIGNKIYAKTDNDGDLSLTTSGAYDQLGWIVAVPATGTLHVQLMVPGQTSD